MRDFLEKYFGDTGEFTEDASISATALIILATCFFLLVFSFLNG